MNTIWIVEYGYDGIGEADCFSSAWSTKEKALAAAHREADNNLKDRDDPELVSVETEDSEGNLMVGIFYHDIGSETDWWKIREVPFDR
jgi:hypothetical protein